MQKFFLLLLVMGLYLSACGPANKTTEVSDITGAYKLVSINGHELPYAPPHEGGAPQVLSSTLTLNPYGTFSMTMTYGTSSGGSVSRDFHGTYTREDSVLRFQWEGAGQTPATLEGNTITIDNEGIFFTYQK